MSKFTTLEKIKIVLDVMQYPKAIARLGRQVSISRSTYYHRQRILPEKGKDRLVFYGNDKLESQRA